MIPMDAQAHAHERARRLHAEAVAERLVTRASARDRAAAYLRHAADRLDTGEPSVSPVPPRPARQC